MRLLRAIARRAGGWCGEGTRRTLASDFLSYPLWRLPGHYYSPLPDPEQARRAAARARAGDAPLTGIPLREASQLQLLERLVPLYGRLEFPAGPAPGWRFYHENNQFPYADAILLHMLLQHWRPRRLVEVGSGFSTALMIDTIERCMDKPVAITCVDPNPERLMAVTGFLPAFVRLIEARVQDVPLTIFDALEPGDILFIDSTHVASTGSDVVYELFEILPRLAPGVRVHFHDIGWPFEYPSRWIAENRAWNEVYAVRAYLADSRAYEVTLFNHMLLVRHREWFARHMPRCLTGRRGDPSDVPGHGLWLLKTGHAALEPNGPER